MYIVEYRNYTEQIPWLLKIMVLEGIVLATMKYRTKYGKIEQCGQKGSATPD